MVRNVLAKEAALSKVGGDDGAYSVKKMREEESALLWEVKALLAQKQLVRRKRPSTEAKETYYRGKRDLLTHTTTQVKEQVHRLMKHAASSSSPHAAQASAVLKQLQTLLGGSSSFDQSASAVLTRAHTAAKLAAALQVKSRTASTKDDVMAEHKVHKALTKKETKKEKAATELHRLERREEAVRDAEKREQDEKALRVSAEREEARGAETARERAREEEEGWVHVDRFVAPWDPCKSGEEVEASDAVRQHRSMCRDLLFIRKATAPEHGKAKETCYRGKRVLL
jgi:hypothetical protein